MAGRQRATFKKRQREAKRVEKQRMKAEKRASRRLEKPQDNQPATFETPLPPGPPAGEDSGF
jgi:hypothetical protein